MKEIGEMREMRDKKDEWNIINNCLDLIDRRVKDGE